MSKNIYNLFREYNRLLTKPQKSKYLASLDYNIRESFKRLLKYADNSERFENIYDGWINSVEEEIVVLEIYSAILGTRANLQKFCVDDKQYEKFLKNKKEMLLLLLNNKQYQHASILLEVNMFSEAFKQKKLEELREKVLEYLVSKRMVLPKKLINIRNDVLPIKELQDAVEQELKSTKIKKIVDCLVDNNRVK